MGDLQPAVHHTILVVDVEGYGDLRKTTPHRLSVRAGLFLALQRAFDDTGLPWPECRRECTGDGVFVLAPAQLPKGPFVEFLPSALAEALRRHNESHRPEEQIRLRMALNAGEVTYDDHGVTAPSINRTFRLLEAPPLRSALADSPGVLALITSNWFFHEVVRNSKNVDASTFRPVRVAVKETSATGWISLPDHPFPPEPAAPEPPRPARSTLPPDLPAFTGRADELARLAKAVDRNECALHTLDGMPGVGKTAFAVHAAHRLADHFPDGRFFLELHGHTPGRAPVEPADALASLLLSWGVAARGIPPGTDDRARLWREQLAGRKVLLVLDDAVSLDQIRPLLPTDPGCLVLVTSRRRIGTVDGCPLSLQELSAPDAAAMFTAQTREHRHELDAVAELMVLCGYLPLAIALTAGRLRGHPSWTARHLVEDLAGSRGRLRGFRADDRTVAAAFDLSYRDLTADQQRLFRRLALHPGTHIDAHAAAALDDDDLDKTRDRLESLYLNNLLEEPEPGRYRMHDLTRAYSATCGIDPADDDAAVDRLLGYYVTTIRAAIRFVPSRTPRPAHSVILPLRSPEFFTERAAIAWLSAEKETIRAAVTHAATHRRPRQAAELAVAIHPYLDQFGHWHDALAVHEAAVTAATRHRNIADEATALTDLGRIQFLLGEKQAAAGSLAQAHVLHRQCGNQLGEANALIGLGHVHGELAEYAEATECITRAQERYSGLNNRHGVASALLLLANLRFGVGDYPAAAATGSQALVHYIELDNWVGETLSLLVLGCVQGITGKYHAARAAFTRALFLARQIGDRFSEAKAVSNLGRVHYDLGEHGQAAEFFHRAHTLYVELGNRMGEAVTLANLGKVLHATGNFDTALDHLDRARVLFGVDKAWQAENLNNLGALALDWPEAGNPRDYFRQALHQARAIGAQYHEARALEGLGQTRVAQADFSSGIAYLRQALTLYKRLGVPESTAVAGALAELDRLHLRTRRTRHLWRRRQAGGAVGM